MLQPQTLETYCHLHKHNDWMSCPRNKRAKLWRFYFGGKKLNGKKKPQHHWLNQVGRIHSVSSLIICSSVVKCDVRPYLHGPENHQGWRLHSFFGHLVQLLEYPHSGEKGMKDEYITDRSEKIKEGKINKPVETRQFETTAWRQYLPRQDNYQYLTWHRELHTEVKKGIKMSFNP